MLERAFAVAAAVLEGAAIVAARRGQVAQPLEQPLGELATVHLAVLAMPFALAMPLAVLEAAGVPAAVGVIDTALALQQAINHLPPVTPPVGQACVRRKQRFAIATGGEQQDQGNGEQWTHGEDRAIGLPSMTQNGILRQLGQGLCGA
ncbi:hypothetical protein D3C81_1782350 [compost metagenome]